MDKKLILLGGGGHGRVLLETLTLLGIQKRVAGVMDPNHKNLDQKQWQVPLLGDDEQLLKMSPQLVQLINGLGSVSNTTQRRDLFNKFRSRAYPFVTICHPTAWVADSATLAEGVQIMAGAVVQTGCWLAENVLVNTRAVLDHDCRIQKHVHIATGALLCGGVSVGEGTHIGAGATVIQGVCIGENVMIAAGSVVVRDLPKGAKVAGVPAKEWLQ